MSVFLETGKGEVYENFRETLHAFSDSVLLSHISDLLKPCLIVAYLRELVHSAETP